MDDLATLVARLDEVDVGDEDAAFATIRDLARADGKAFVDALLSLPDGSTRGEAIEALVTRDAFESAFEPIVDALVAFVVDELRADTDPGSSKASDAAMAFYPLGDLERTKIREPFADALYDRVRVVLEHPKPEVRMTIVELVAVWARPSRVGALDPVLNLFERDPDPLVRDAAYRSLAEVSALPIASAMVRVALRHPPRQSRIRTR